MDRIRVAPDVSWWPIEFAEHWGIQSSYADLMNPTLLSLPAVATGSWLLPTHNRWVPGIDDAKGYIVVHVELRKLKSVEQFPDRFLHRARKEFPDVLTVGLDRFNRNVDISQLVSGT